MPDDQFIDEAEADEATQNQLKLILLIIVIALLFGLYVISRTDDSDELLSSQTTVVDKIWDDDDINETIDANIDIYRAKLLKLNPLTSRIRSQVP